MNGQLWWYAARSGGYVAWGLLSASVIWGLMLSGKVRPGHVRPNWILDLHRFLGSITVAALALHLGALVVDADASATYTAAAGWDGSAPPQTVAVSPDMAIYELHVRDFSANDPTVPAEHRGKYLAFTDSHSNGMKHLKALADARDDLAYIDIVPAMLKEDGTPKDIFREDRLHMTAEGYQLWTPIVTKSLDAGQKAKAPGC